MIGFLSNKKGQFYILVALLLISYAFTLARQDVPIRKSKDNFQLLHEGFVSEGTAVINNAVYEEANVSASFSGFADDYLAFARSAEPGFRAFFLLKDGGLLTIGNRLDDSVNVTVSNVSRLVASSSDITVAAGDASFELSGVSYSFKFSPEPIQLKAVFKTSDKLTKRVFVKG
ncbi:hypothetical protein HYU18_03800 [Candidatus Woesearchaeota archaeon]|nr:hypothetical protein [Candidatus Woesearchaeota archaeon]